MLAAPFARRKKAPSHKNTAEGIKNNDMIRIAETYQSWMLAISPVNMNIPLRKRSPAQKRIS